MLVCLVMIGEDFGYFLFEIKGFMFWLGVDFEYSLYYVKFSLKEEVILFVIDVLIYFLESK